MATNRPGLGVAFTWHFMLVQCLLAMLGPAALQADGLESSAKCHFMNDAFAVSLT